MEIRIEHLSMTYPSGKQALKDLDLELKAPSLIGLLGPNGAGKSTLMKLLVAALLPTRGEILVDGQPLDRTERLLKARLGYLPQDFGLFDELAVTQFLDYMAALKGIGDPKAAIQKAVRAVNLEEKARAKIRTLSGGQRQAMALLMSTMTPIEFLILDEHTAALDPKTAEVIMELTDRIIREKKLTALMVTHNLRYAVEYGNRLLMMHQGQAVMDKAYEEKESVRVDDILGKFNEISIECGN